MQIADLRIFLFVCFVTLDLFIPISGLVDRASASEVVDSGSIPSLVQPKTKKLVFTVYPAWRSAKKKESIF